MSLRGMGALKCCGATLASIVNFIRSANEVNLTLFLSHGLHFGQGFFAQTLHQPLLATRLLPYTAQLPDSSVDLPWNSAHPEQL